MANRAQNKLTDLRRSYPPSIVWGRIAHDLRVPVFFDDKLQVVEPLTLYALYEAQEFAKRHHISTANSQAYLSDIRSIAYALKSFLDYLRAKRLSWNQFSDEHMDAYKRDQFATILSKSSSVSESTAQETVNQKLRVIYNFFWWAQEEQLLIADHIGWSDHPIRSKIVEYKQDPEKFEKNARAKRTIYPQAFRRTGARSRLRRGHYATDQEVAAVRKNFRAKCDPLTADRNILITDLIELRGWRSGSVRSLRIEQFSDELIDRALTGKKAEFEVVPPDQKFGYQRSYDLKMQMAIRINKFIHTTRKEMLARIRKPDSGTGPLFISYTTGKPLGLGAISRILASSFSAVSAPKRAGAHSLRRKFGREKATEICQIRMRQGVSMDPADIVNDMKEELGQSSQAAQSAYTMGKLDMYSYSVENKLRGQIVELQTQLASRDLQLAKLARAARRKKLSKA
jgi:hypothetical protein